MEPIRDPEGIEIEYLNRTGAIHGRKVVEIGCGNGRLIWRYANIAASVVGVDPDFERLTKALTKRPDKVPTKCRRSAENLGKPRQTSATVETWAAFAQTEAERLPFPDEAFESAFLAWSL
jgi:ubiquinone/menaquinone biosynthesis C-methylase UbiE